MTTTAIILAGGKGTRLRSVVKDIPKPMAPVNGEPFLKYVLRYLSANGIQNVVLSVGYRHEVILDYFGDSYQDIAIRYSIENTPLGTGGAILKAAKLVEDEAFFALNGDSLFRADLKQMADFAAKQAAQVVLALKKMHQIDRYGIVDIGENGQIQAFQEKKYVETGLINTGVYWLKKKDFLALPFAEQFSFEKDFLEKYTTRLRMFGCVLNGYFIDIGIPSDYAKAQKDLS